VRPGEIVPGDGPVPEARHDRTATVAITNRGRFTAYVTSHYPVARLSPSLDLERDGLEGARPLLPSGGSVEIAPGATVEVEVTWD
jgi:urease beta subunit